MASYCEFPSRILFSPADIMALCFRFQPSLPHLRRIRVPGHSSIFGAAQGHRLIPR
jgi:hypothetical protein